MKTDLLTVAMKERVKYSARLMLARRMKLFNKQNREAREYTMSIMLFQDSRRDTISIPMYKH